MRNKLFYYANPNHISAEIKRYGYEISVKKMTFLYMLYIAATMVVGLLFKVPTITYIIFMIAGIFFMPVIIINAYKNQYEQQRFSDLSQYMEQMLYSFRVNKKIVNSLKDTSGIFEAGDMRDCIDEAIAYIFTQKSENSVREALKIIEKKYPCEKLRTMHKFMLSVERNGGNYEKSLNLLLEDRSMWADRQLLLAKERRDKRRSVIFAMACASFLYWFIHLQSISLYNLEDNIFIQVSITLAGLIYMFLYAKCDNALSVDWLQQKDVVPADKIEKYVEDVSNFDPQKALKKAINKGIIFIIGGIGIGVFGIVDNDSTAFIMAAIFIIAGIIFIARYKAPYILKMKKLQRECEIKFPRWLMEIALLLQTDSVQKAISKSIPTAPTIMKNDLIALRNEIYKNNTSVEPYNRFLKRFDLPEISASMKMLYAISTGKGGDSDTQINDIIRRNNLMLDKAEKMHNEDLLASIRLYSFAPEFVATAQIIVELVVFTVAMFTTNMVV